LSDAAAAPIALVGVGCRFPGATGVGEFWDLIRSGRSGVRYVPDHRVELGFNTDVIDPRPGRPGRITSARCGFLDHPELFDPRAFGLTPRDAVAMEPQQRLVVEVVWDALEDAGIVPESLEGERVAVLFGHMAEDYSREQIAVLGEERFRNSLDVWAVAGIARAVVTGRVSFLLGVKGPSFVVDTACSSSLLTVHLACQSIWSGESSMALAGGVNLFLSPEGMIALSRVGMLANDGHCKAFDDSANGFVRSEGAGVVVLRPLADAIAEGNPIYAVVRGTGFSADGRDGGHMMAPGRFGQVQAMRDAYARAGVDPARVQFVETHGTGTTIGDPVEIQALNDVMGPGRPADRPLRVSSVKGNIGHAESASGIAGLIKAALCVRHRELPAQLHFNKPSRAIPWDEVAIRVQTELEPWPVDEPALVGVNSFGISGTNAHVVLEEYRETPARPEVAKHSEPTPLLFTFSAHTPDALAGTVRNFERHVRDAVPDSELEDLGYTLSRRRSQRAHRLSLVASTADELADELAHVAAGDPSRTTHAARSERGDAPSVGFVFAGHGGHWFGMGRVLLRRQPVFREALEAWDVAQRRVVDWSLIDVLLADEADSILERVDVIQSVVTGVAVGLARVWAHFGVRPAHVVGHSVGEIAAAHVAGILSLEDAALVACERGRVIRELAPLGAMGVVALPSDELSSDLACYDGRVAIAGRNGPSTTVISGEVDAVEAAIEALEGRGVFARKLAVEYASHSPQMEPLREELSRRVAAIEPRAGDVPFTSTVTGQRLAGEELTAEYWGRNLRAPVLLDDAVGSLVESGTRVFLELSPHPVLGGAVRDIARARDVEAAVFSSLRRGEDDELSLLASLGGLFTRGCAVDFEALYPEGRVVGTPLYAYQKLEYWYGARRGTQPPKPTQLFPGLNGVKARRTDSSVRPGTILWELEIGSDVFAADNRTAGCSELPGGALLAMALAVGPELWPGSTCRTTGLEIENALVCPEEDERRLVQIVAESTGEGACIQLSSRPLTPLDETNSACWVRHLRADVWPVEPERRSAARASRRGDDCGERESTGSFYETLASAGFERSEGERFVAGVWHGDGAVLAALRPPPESAHESERPGLHPGYLDAVSQLLSRAGARREETPGQAWQLSGCNEIEIVADATTELYAHLRLCGAERSGDGESARAGAVRGELAGDVELFARDGSLVATLRGLRGVPIERADIGESAAGWRYERTWRELDAGSLPADASAPTRWLVVGRDPLFRTTLASALRERGLEVRELAAESAPQSATDSASDSARDAAETAVVRWLERSVGSWCSADWGVVVAADEPAGRLEPEAQALAEQADQAGRRLAILTAAVQRTAGARRIWLVTRDAQRVVETDRVRGRLGGVLWGTAEELSRADGRESEAGRALRCVDVSAGFPVDEREALSLLIRSEPAESAERAELRVALREDRCFGLRVVGQRPPSDSTSSAARATAARDRRFEARLTDAQRLSPVEFFEVEAASLDAGEVELEVRAAGLTFLDVLASMGLERAGAEGELGWECAGVVTRVGEGVDGLLEGDAVFGFARGCVATHVRTPAALLARKPAAIDFAEAAALPLSQVVAEYALDWSARVRAGERVVIHGAAGSIGRAAVDLARERGVRVLATARSERKRRELIAASAERVCDARSESVTREIEEWTDGEGVDVVLDLAGGPRLRGTSSVPLGVLAPGGRYLEIERPGLAAGAASLPALDGACNVSYHAIDPVGLLSTKPDELAELLRRLAERLEAGWVPPETAVRFPIDQASRAIRYMAQARNRSRVVLDLAGAPDTPVRAHAPRPRAALEEGTLLLASRSFEAVVELGCGLIREGAQSLLALVPEGAGRVARSALAEQAERAGGRVCVEEVDAASGAGLRDILERERSAEFPVRGVVWLDAPLVSGACARIAELAGTEAALADETLDFCWLISRGSDRPAEAFGAGVVARRLARGLAATHVVVDRAGSKPDGEDEDGAVAPLVGFDALRSLLDDPRDLVILSDCDPESWRLRVRPGDALLADLGATASADAASAGADARARLRALDEEARHAAIKDALSECMVRVLRLGSGGADQLDWHCSLGELGLDSLMAVELQVRLIERLGVELSLVQLFDGSTLGDVMKRLDDAAQEE